MQSSEQETIKRYAHAHIRASAYDTCGYYTYVRIIRILRTYYTYVCGDYSPSSKSRCCVAMNAPHAVVTHCLPA